MKTSYSAIGVMAGSSMDGLDLTHVTFSLFEGRWMYDLGKCEIICYSQSLFKDLKRSPSLDVKERKKISIALGEWIGEEINKFKLGCSFIDIVAVHGHTSIHDPKNGISEQLGDGGVIASKCKIPTVTEFRSMDIKFGGQGAPLVPLGDFFLFEDYDACLNLGGIANISIKKDQTAWDICPCNQVLNYFAKKLGLPYDEGGRRTKSGRFDANFYNKISSLDYFKQRPPKSLSNSYISNELLNEIPPANGLYTYTIFISDCISQNLNLMSGKSQLLITGGGAFNTTLVEEISKRLYDYQIIVGDTRLISFKESLIFAFLGIKKFRNEINVLASVTGSSRDTCSGVIFFPNKITSNLINGK